MSSAAWLCRRSLVSCMRDMVAADVPGNYDESVHGAGYLTGLTLIPDQTHEAEGEIIRHHVNNRYGMVWGGVV